MVGLWPGPAAALRERAMALEIDGEHVALLALGRVVSVLRASGRPAILLAGANLQRYWQFDDRDRHALRTLLSNAFPDATPGELEVSLAWLQD